ncbi:MAG: peptidoglycan DD-metalloendopeptidase family protein [Gudongella sp.]|jgi:murein DD-endopeptidase MepM/ murein hydrolase activator NlpD|nr:peptidoglycan DD-metalloendopeptidase family protein [Gudongella sp.]
MMKDSSPLNFERIIKLLSFKNRTVMIVIALGIIVSMIGAGYASNSANEAKTRAFEVYLGGESIGVVRAEDEAISIYNEIRQNLINTYDMGVVLDKELEFEPSHANDEEITSVAELRINIKSKVSFQVTGYTLDIDGDRLGVFKSREEVNYILDSIKQPFLPKLKYEEPQEEIAEPEEEVVIAKTHTIKSGENFWTIAKDFNTSPYTLMELNPQLNPDKLKPGDVVKLGDGEMPEKKAEAAAPGIDDSRDVKIRGVEFAEDVVVKAIPTNYGSLSDAEKAIEAIRAGKEAMRIHKVEVGESFWIIARMYETTVEELELANPELNPAKLQPGNEVKLFVPVPLLTVVTHEEVQYIADVDFDTEVKEDDSMYKNQKKILVKGVKGKSDILAEEIRHNGMLVDEIIINEIVLEEPMTEIVAQGTKALPKTAAVGSFGMPTKGRISSPYGMRNGSMHRGIDLANGLGTSVYAADGGKVTFAGYKGSYGYLVEINHENGYVTRYAHNSKILVKAGDRVYKGQLISYMGSTGRSTGSHLHFEVLKNGANQNPYGYIFK